MLRMRIAQTLCVLVLVLPCRATAQAVDGRLRERALKIVTREQVLPVLRDGAGDSSQASVEPKFVLVGSTTGDVTGKARIGWIPQNRALVDAIVSGPISEGQARFVSLDGLGNSVSLQLRFQYAWKFTHAREAQRLFMLDRATGAGRTTGACTGTIDEIDQAICLAAARAADDLITTRIQPLTRASKDLPTVRNEIRNSILNNRVDHTATNSRLEANEGFAINLDELQEAFTRQWLRSLRRGEVQTTGSVIISGSFLTANQRFSFVDSLTLVTQRENRINRSGQVGIGFARERGVQPLLFVGGGYAWGTTYEGQPKSDLCQPFVGESLRCQNVAIGGPMEGQVKRLNIEGRAWLLSSKLAVSTRYIRDMEKDTNTVEFPVYFLQNVKDIEQDPAAQATPALTGGLTAGWQRRATQTEFYVYLFVGTVLGIPGLR